jgi:hypothetical protein
MFQLDYYFDDHTVGSRYNVWSTFQGRSWIFKDTNALMKLSLLEAIR